MENKSGSVAKRLSVSSWWYPITETIGVYMYRETWRWDTLLILRRTYFRIRRGLSVASCASSKDTQPHALSSNTGTRLISSGEEATAAIAENEIRITAHRCASMDRINSGRIRRSHLNDFQWRGFQDYLRGKYDIMV